jgi:hypothetical protein
MPAPGGVPPPTAPPPAPKRKLWIAVVAVVVIVVLVVAVLFLGGVFKTGGTTANVVGAATDYSSAEPQAQGASSSTSGGPWTLIAAEGLNMSSSISNPDYGGLSGGSGCSYTAVTGAPSNVVFPATASTATPGTAATWIFISDNSAGDLLFVLTAQGTSTAIVEGNAQCGAGFSGSTGLSGKTVADSTTIATTANSDGGSSFLASHPGATELFVLVSASSVTGWEVSYSTCAFAASGSGTTWTALFNATGSVLEPGSSTTGACDGA